MVYQPIVLQYSTMCYNFLMKSTLFIIPGFRQSIKSDQYKKLSNTLGKKYNTVLVPITWNRRVMSDYVNEALNFITNYHKTSESFDVLGFSFGAMIAFITAPALSPRRLFLCSLSPYFKEDIPIIRNRWKRNIGGRRVSDFENFNFQKIVPTIKSKTIIFVGSQELIKYPILANRIKFANKFIKNSQLITIDNVGHDIGSEQYQKVIYGAI